MNKYIEYRREFHKFPEIGWHEYRTSARVAEILTEMGYEVLMGSDVVNEGSIGEPEKLSESEIKVEMERAIKQGANPEFVEATKGLPGVIAIFDTGIEGPITAFRFDIDCLPYDEPKTEGYRPYDEGYVSCNKDAVHACGHDGHTAMGLGIAEKLIENKNQFKGKIKLIFQPAEETFYGAQSIVDKGHLDDCMNFISMHLALSADNRPLKSNTIACGCKDFLSDRQLDVYFHGKAAHPCGASQDGKNALLAASSAALNLHAIAPHEEGLCRVNVGEIHAGVAANTIAPNAMLRIEYRGQTPAIAEYAGRRVFDVLEGSCRAYDINYSYIDYGEVSAGASDDEMMRIIERAAKNVPWFETVYFEGNVGGSDDAAVMMSKVQANGGIGTYIGIGSDTTQPLHNAEFDFDEDAIEPAIDLCMNALKELHGR
ncbi:MAG: amidohydrolase [Eubacteriales bacterium]|nr:amidohydrolase [Eubacteriales bacterium]